MLGTITVVNKRTHVADEARDVYIARPSPLASPFVVVTAADRGRALGQYLAWMQARWAEGGRERREIEALARRVSAGEDLNLVCFCAPERCHGDYLRLAIIAEAERLNDAT